MKGNELELVPAGTSDKDLRDEVNARTAKAGYTTRYGENRAATKIMAVVNWGTARLNVWPRNSRGNLIP